MSGAPQRAVLLLNLGGPETLADIRGFLTNLFSDRDIIRLPGGAALQPLLARLIAALRAPKVAPLYGAIGGGSPILALTRAQAKALAQETGLPCYVAMRYSPPFVEDALKEAAASGAAEIVALPLFPHYSRATTGSVFAEIERARARLGVKLKVRRVRSYPDHAGYVAALAETITEALARFSEAERPKVRLIFSAHGLPVSFTREGDPYVAELERTIRALEGVMALPRWDLTFQSRTGPMRWLEPTTRLTLEKLLAEGVRHLVMVPISFVSDHLETLHEMDILYRGQAEAARAVLIRAPALNDRPAFIAALAQLVGSAA